MKTFELKADLSFRANDLKEAFAFLRDHFQRLVDGYDDEDILDQDTTQWLGTMNLQPKKEDDEI